MKKLHKLLVILLSLCVMTALAMVPALAAEEETVIDVENTTVEGTHPEPVVIKAAGVKFAEGAKLDGGLKVAAPVEVVVPTGVTVAALEVSVEAEGASLTVDEGAVVEAVTVAAPATVEIKGEAGSVTVAETAATETAKASVTVADTAKVSGSVDVKAAVAVEIKGEAGSVKVAESAKGVELTVAKTASVAEMKVEAPDASIKVDGKVESMEVAADNVSVSGTGEVTNAVVTAGDGVSFKDVAGNVKNEGEGTVQVNDTTLEQGESAEAVPVKTTTQENPPAYTGGGQQQTKPKAKDLNVVVAPLVARGADKKESYVKGEALYDSKSGSYGLSEGEKGEDTPSSDVVTLTDGKILGSYKKDNVTYTVTRYVVTIHVDKLQAHYNSEPALGYWVGLGIQNEGETDYNYAYGAAWLKDAEVTELEALPEAQTEADVEKIIELPGTGEDGLEKKVDDTIALLPPKEDEQSEGHDKTSTPDPKKEVDGKFEAEDKDFNSFYFGDKKPGDQALGASGNAGITNVPTDSAGEDNAEPIFQQANNKVGCVVIVKEDKEAPEAAEAQNEIVIVEVKFDATADTAQKTIPGLDASGNTETQAPVTTQAPSQQQDTPVNPET